MSIFFGDIAWLLSPRLQTSWEDYPCITPSILFVSHSVREVFLACMRDVGGISRFQCSSFVYELHAHTAPRRTPGMYVHMPLHWVIVDMYGGRHSPPCPCTALWYRSRDGFLRVHEDAWDVMPQLHDGSMCAYDFNLFLHDLDMVSLPAFFEGDVLPMLHVIDCLMVSQGRYHEFTRRQGIRRLGMFCNP